MSEKDYVRYLVHERHMFAWCLITHGGVAPVAALTQAEVRYPFEAATEPFRGIIFHDVAWHWAMLALFGQRYWHSHPEFQFQSDGYRAESYKYDTATNNPCA